MAAKRHGRSVARESALALLYSSEITEADAADIIEHGQYPADDLVLSDYAESLVMGVEQRCAEIDEHLRETSENWALDRMPAVDRAILRLAVYEMLYVDDVPVSVTINEAVELAKRFGGEDDSSRFVNGILGRIARAMEAGGIVAVSAEGADEVAEAAETAENSAERMVAVPEEAEKQPVSDSEAPETPENDENR